MIRRLTGSGLTLAMIALIVLRIPALGFCPCEQDLTFSGGFCCEDHAISCVFGSNCCSSESSEEEKSCQDCLIVLSFDPGDFNWSGPRAQFLDLKTAPTALPAGRQNGYKPERAPLSLNSPTRKTEPPGQTVVLMKTGILRL